MTPKKPTKTKKKAARPRACKCFEQADKALAKQGAQLQWAWSIHEGFIRVVIATERLDPRSRVKLKTLAATFCPFCGKAYPEPPDEKKPRAA